MGKFVRRLCCPAGFALGTLGALLSACPGDKGGAVDTAGCSPEEEPGYGTLGLSYVMADEYTASMGEKLHEGMTLWIYHVEQDLGSCEDYDYPSSDYLFAVKSGLTLNDAYLTPAGRTCAYTSGYERNSSNSAIYCHGDMGLTMVPECARVDTTVIVTCEQVPADILED